MEASTVDVIPELGRADWAKLDIEGAEWELLGDPRFAQNAPADLVLEYHASGSPRRDFRGAIRGLLKSAGYAVGPDRWATANAGVLWAAREPR